MASTPTDRGLDRLMSFTDGAAAIALTLLILPLVDVASDIEHSSLTTMLGDNASLLLAFAITFAVIARFWYTHHQVFEQVQAYDGALLALTLLWLFGIVSFPFSANVLAYTPADGDPWVSGFYIGTMLFTSLWVVAIELYLRRHVELLRDADPTGLRLGGAVSFCVVLAVAMIVAVAVPSIGLLSLLLLLVVDPAERLVAAARRA